jgi:hypothetical protein
MTRRRPSRLRVIVQSVVSATIGFALVALILVFFFDGDRDETAEISDGAISVEDAIAIAEPDERVAVSGFVFVGERRTILCSARNHDDPPYCEGVAIDLRNLDPNRLDLAIPDDAPAYSREEVTLLGDYRFGVLTVTEVLQS